MRLTVLGSSGTYPGPGKACSGYLISEGDTRLLLDCGSGVLASLQKHLPLKDLTGIVITHMHADHFLDLVLLRYALVYGEQPSPRPLPVFLPPGGCELWKRLTAPFQESDPSFPDAFALSEYRASQSHRFGALDLQFASLNHWVANYGIKVRAKGSIVYSGDTGPNSELVILARQADLFLCEATWPDGHIPQGERGHLTAREAGKLAREAGVRRLLLTHLSPAVDANKALESARASFGGEVSLAEEGKTYIADES